MELVISALAGTVPFVLLAGGMSFLGFIGGLCIGYTRGRTRELRDAHSKRGGT